MLLIFLVTIGVNLQGCDELWGGERASSQPPLPPAFQLFNFNTSRVSAGTEIAQTAKISQRGHKVTQIR